MKIWVGAEGAGVPLWAAAARAPPRLHLAMVPCRGIEVGSSDFDGVGKDEDIEVSKQTSMPRVTGRLPVVAGGFEATRLRVSRMT